MPPNAVALTPLAPRAGHARGLGACAMGSATATVSVRRQRGPLVEDREWDSVPVGLLQSACPWRTFRWYKGQKHYSGTYWPDGHR